MKTIFIPFEGWMPDRASLDTGSIHAQEVIPTAESFESGPGYTPSTIYPDLPEDPLVVRAFETSDGDTFTLAFCPTKIYSLSGAVWNNVSRLSSDYSTAAGTGFWSIDQWGDIVYATNYVDPIQ